MNSKMSIKDMVRDGKEIGFVCYRDSQLWYKHLECGFEFPVPIEDIGNATFLATDKAMLFMRYIRKHLALIEAAKVELTSGWVCPK